jgi:hypothetical protein
MYFFINSGLCFILFILSALKHLLLFLLYCIQYEQGYFVGEWALLGLSPRIPDEQPSNPNQSISSYLAKRESKSSTQQQLHRIHHLHFFKIASSLQCRHQ